MTLRDLAMRFLPGWRQCSDLTIGLRRQSQSIRRPQVTCAGIEHLGDDCALFRHSDRRVGKGVGVFRSAGPLASLAMRWCRSFSRRRSAGRCSLCGCCCRSSSYGVVIRRLCLSAGWRWAWRVRRRRRCWRMSATWWCCSGTAPRSSLPAPPSSRTFRSGDAGAGRAPPRRIASLAAGYRHRPDRCSMPRSLATIGSQGLGGDLLFALPDFLGVIRDLVAVVARAGASQAAAIVSVVSIGLFCTALCRVRRLRQHGVRLGFSENLSGQAVGQGIFVCMPV